MFQRVTFLSYVWSGPFSPERHDLTPCFEYSVLFGGTAAFAIAGFLTRTRYLTRHREPHSLGRTACIYWPTQLSMIVAATAIWTMAHLFYSIEDTPIIFAWSCVTWTAGVILNHYEHKCEIRSSSAIFSFYVVSILAAVTILQTASDPGSGASYPLTPLVVFASTLTAGFSVECWPRGNTHVQQLSNIGMYGKANSLSRLTFWFFTPIISIGLQRIITADDIKGQLPESLATYAGYKRLSRAWDEALQRYRRSSILSKATAPSLFWTILRNSWGMPIPVLLSRVAIVLFSYTLPVLLKELLDYLEHHESKPVSYGITLALGMFTAALLASLLNTYNRYQTLILGLASRSALISMIFRKSLRLSTGSRNESSSGKISNHMAVDADQWWNAIVYISMWIEIPLALTISIRLLYNLLGWSMLAGSSSTVGLQHSCAAFSGSGLDFLRRIGVIEAFMSIIFISSSLIISLIKFSGPIASLSDATTSTIGVLVATRRIQQFLLEEEVDNADITRYESLPRNPLDPVISIKIASFSWKSPLNVSASRPASNERTALLSPNNSPFNPVPRTPASIQITILRGRLTAIYSPPYRFHNLVVHHDSAIPALAGRKVLSERVSNPGSDLHCLQVAGLPTHFHESLGGVSTIRAMRIQDRFIEKNAAMVDRMSSNFLSNMGSRRWLDVQLRILSAIVLLCAALFAVLQRDRMDPSLVGLTLSFTLTIIEEVASLVCNFCDLQRVIEYTSLKTEAPDTTNVLLPANWPSEGQISFKNYSARYREGLDLVIRHVSVDILPVEKIGSYWAKESDNSRVIVADAAPIGPLDQVGYCILEESGGSIEIDGVDISTVGLEDLRRHLAIIPQDPTLFAGSVRDNLDPFQELEDADPWEALERAHLKDAISALPGGLAFEVSSNGDNFSVGQRSLICLARALLRKTKILVLDEATTAMDVETDELIQKRIQQEFDRTILTIAHRIKTVMDSDKIPVLEKGRVGEFERPSVLLQREGSLFYRLAEQAGEV
ncbi:CD9 antigen [Mortierella sp. 14UC]|nr:CD9 antigen [Mortierella sp. 14UC]